jgi:hypothetical protein
MPIANIVIIMFVLIMAYFGTVYGLFSSFLHLMVVITVGTIAFALWEPLTLGLLIKYVPPMAWSLGLLVPFGVLLLVFRMVSDKLIPRDADFLPIVNTVLGAACGAISGILTAGIVVIGLGFMPFGADMGGYQPYSLGGGGKFEETGGKLWVPVHNIAANFFNGLSGGAFSTSTPMAEYMPDLDVQMSLVRVRPDFVSIVASPDAVTVTGAYVADAANLSDASPATAEALGPDFRKPDYKLVIVDTDWAKKEGTVDGDRKLRLPASQVRLVTKSSVEGDATEMIGPAGFATVTGDGEARVFYPYAGGVQAEAPAPTKFSFVFLVKADQRPTFLMVRKLRVNLPGSDDIKSAPAEVLAALGAPPVPKADDDDDEAAARTGGNTRGQTSVSDPSGIRAGSLALQVQVTNSLPMAISKNATTGLSYTTVKEKSLIDTGNTGQSRKTTGTIGARSKVSGFDVPSHEAMIRVRIEYEKGQSVFAGGMSGAAALNPIFLLDTKGEQWPVTAWVWKKENKSQDIHYDAFNPIRSGKQMPISRMNKGDEFYLYFTVTKPVEIISYNIGDVSDQAFEPPLMVQ